jgi:predicted nucleic acid-binding Zn ribbon protein
MTDHYKKSSDWMLTRQRFQITDPQPPAPRHEERSIGSILADILQDEPPAESLPEILKDRWHLIVGEQIAKHTGPSSLSHGVLTIDADHPGWLAEVRRLPKPHLLKKMMSIPNIPDISDTRFRLDPVIQTKKRWPS